MPLRSPDVPVCSALSKRPGTLPQQLCLKFLSHPQSYFSPQIKMGQLPELARESSATFLVDPILDITDVFQMLGKDAQQPIKNHSLLPHYLHRNHRSVTFAVGHAFC